MIPVLLAAAISVFLFSQKKSDYEPFIQDLSNKYGINKHSWIHNMRITKDGKGLAIGDNDIFLLLIKDTPISIYLDNKEIELNTKSLNKAMDNIMNIIKLAPASSYVKTKLLFLLKILIKYKETYIKNKYQKH